MSSLAIVLIVVRSY